MYCSICTNFFVCIHKILCGFSALQPFNRWFTSFANRKTLKFDLPYTRFVISETLDMSSSNLSTSSSLQILASTSWNTPLFLSAYPFFGQDEANLVLSLIPCPSRNALKKVDKTPDQLLAIRRIRFNISTILQISVS